jgi:hypothetical protein
MTRSEIAALLGYKGPDSLRGQIKRGVLHAEKIGTGLRSVWVVPIEEVERYQREHQGKGGFAASDHPLHGKRGDSGRPKEDAD